MFWPYLNGPFAVHLHRELRGNCRHGLPGQVRSTFAGFGGRGEAPRRRISRFPSLPYASRSGHNAREANQNHWGTTWPITACIG